MFILKPEVGVTEVGNKVFCLIIINLHITQHSILYRLIKAELDISSWVFLRVYEIKAIMK